MKQIIVTLFLVMCVVATANSNQLPFGGGILMPNGNLIPGAISCIWTKLFEDLDKKYVDRSGADVVQEMIKYLRGIDLALQYKNVSDLLPLLIRYQKYLKDLLKFIRDQNIHAAVCEIIEGNIKVENDFAKSGLVNLTALNTYVKYSANQMNNILTLNDRCRIENKHGEIIL